MELITPMEPQQADEVPEGDEWVYQVKWDGVRVLTYVDGGVHLFNRKQHERTWHYPEIVRFVAGLKHSVILDGEVIALVDGLPFFHEVLKRDLIRNPDKVQQRKRQVPIFYMIFDIVFCDRWIHRMPLIDRIDLLTSMVQPEEHVQLVDFQEDGDVLFDVMKSRGMEGIVAKRRRSLYLIGQKKEWQKIKNYQDLIAVVGGFTLSGGVVNAILLGLYDQQGRFSYIGHTGTGKLTHAEWRELTQILRPLVVQERPFYNRPVRQKDVYWVKPQLTVKVKYIQWTEGHSLRQPSIEGFVKVWPSECRM